MSRLFVRVALAAAGAISLAAAPAQAQQLSPNAAGVAQAAIGGRGDRSPEENKLDLQLMFAVRAFSEGMQSSRIPQSIQPGVQAFIGENVAADQTMFVVIKAGVTGELALALKNLGSYDISEFPQYGTITARVPVTAITMIAARAEVIKIGPQETYETHRYIPTDAELAARAKAIRSAVTNAGSVTWEGVAAHKADVSQSNGILGSGVKVCVISDGVNTLATRQSSGELGAVTVLSGQAGSGDEGTAMLEIVHDMAPSASLGFATALPSAAQFATNILNLRNTAACDVIVDDVSYFNEGVFQDGIIAQAVNTVTASGALYFSSAANSGNVTHGTSGTYEGDFVASPSAVPAAITSAEGGATVVLHSFGATPYTTLTKATSRVTLHWSDPLGQSGNDYDVFVMDSTGTSILGVAGTQAQSGLQDPYEMAYCNSCNFPIGARIYVVKYSGAARAFHLDTHRGAISNGTTGSTYGHNAAASAFTVAAVDVRTAGGGAFVGGATNPVTYYSSDGLRKIFYNPDGSAITPGYVLFGSGGGTTLQKPDLAASDCGTTTTPGFIPFCGTSAAAPTAAAIAALYKSANPGFTKAQITSALLNSALDIEAAGTDRDSGVGIVMAPQPAPRPDLVVTAMSAGASAQSGSVLTGSATVMNNGTASAGANRLEFYASTNNVITTLDTDTGWGCNVPALAPGASFSCSGTISALSLPVGTYYFGAIADSGEVVSESDETNNARAASATTQITAGTPGAPTIISIVPGAGTATINFTAPSNTGGTPIVSYTATCTASGKPTRSATGSASPITVSGLLKGVTYSCSIAASNGTFSSAASGVVSVAVVKGITLAPLLMLLLN